jgi:hypothetical protein
MRRKIGKLYVGMVWRKTQSNYLKGIKKPSMVTHTWQCHNKTPAQLLYTSGNAFKKNIKTEKNHLNIHVFSLVILSQFRLFKIPYKIFA